MNSALIPSVSYDSALAIGPKVFVENYLFPAMRREHGNGFAMSQWRFGWRDGGPNHFDDLWDRQRPACDTIMCIGGTMEAITGIRSTYQLGAILGLDREQSEALFFKWKPDDGGRIKWPKALAIRFKQAPTPAEKEAIAEEVVLLAIKTKGRCFRRSWWKFWA